MGRYLFRMALEEKSSVLRSGMETVVKGEDFGNNKEVKPRNLKYEI